MKILCILKIPENMPTLAIGGVDTAGNRMGHGWNFSLPWKTGGNPRSLHSTEDHAASLSVCLSGNRSFVRSFRERAFTITCTINCPDSLSRGQTFVYQCTVATELENMIKMCTILKKVRVAYAAVMVKGGKSSRSKLGFHPFSPAAMGEGGEQVV